MTSRDFCYWLQGYFEMDQGKTITLGEGQIQMIKKHLQMVFAHEIDKQYPNQEALSKIHSVGISMPHDPNITVRC